MSAERWDSDRAPTETEERRGLRKKPFSVQPNPPSALPMQEGCRWVSAARDSDDDNEPFVPLPSLFDSP